MKIAFDDVKMRVKGLWSSLVEKLNSQGNLSVAKRIEFYDKLTFLLSSGAPLLQTLDRIMFSYNKRGLMKSTEGFAISQIVRFMKKAEGDTFYLSDAMRSQISPVEYMILRAGDESGEIVPAINQARNHLKTVKNIGDSLKKSLIPSFVLVFVLFLLITFLSFSLYPTLSEMMRPEDRPAVSSALLFFLSIFKSYWWMVIIVLGGTISAFFMSLSRWSGESRQFVIHRFPYDIYTDLVGAGFLSSLAGMMEAGIPMQKSLGKILLSSNNFSSFYLEKMLENARFGMLNGEILDCGLFSPLVSVDLEVFGHSSDFAQAIKSIAEEASKKVVSKVGVFGEIMNKLVVILIVSFISFILSGVFSMVEKQKSLILDASIESPATSSNLAQANKFSELRSLG